MSVPPPDFFELVIVDEAHHVPSKTWRAVLDHLDFAAAVLLTRHRSVSIVDRFPAFGPSISRCAKPSSMASTSLFGP